MRRVGLVGSVCKNVSNFGCGVKNDYLSIDAEALLVVVKIMYLLAI